MVSTSVVIPTYNEAANVRPLLRRLSAVLAPDDEIVIVDDGTDDLPDIAARESEAYANPVKVIRRDAPVGGLGGAVVHGIRHSRGDLIVVCDGDLQHPPEDIPALVRRAATADVVVATRYRDGGASAGLSSGWRQVVSSATGGVSKLCFPGRLRGCSDPMSGFFAVRRAALRLDALRPSGFKILLEILLRSGPLRIGEVPYTFAERQAGTSHASLREGGRFLVQLMRARIANKAAAFLLVGLSGVLPNLGVLWLLTRGGAPYIEASIVATQIAIVWNFLGAELLVWRDHRAGHWSRRFAKFLVIGETDLLRLPFVVLLVEYAHVRTVPASALTLLAAFLFRFTLADKIVYRRAPIASLRPDDDPALTALDVADPAIPSLPSKAAATAGAQQGELDVDA